MPAKKRSAPKKSLQKAPASSSSSIPVESSQEKNEVQEQPVTPPTPSPEITSEETTSDTPLAYEQASQALDEESKLARVNKVLFAAGGVATVAIIVASIVVGILVAKTPLAQKQNTEDQTTPMPTPTSAPVFARDAVTFEVLNGSGVAGAAGKAASILTGLGYSVIATGNAPARASVSALFLSTSVKMFESQIVEDMTGPFDVSSISGQLTDSTASARLIVGKK